MRFDFGPTPSAGHLAVAADDDYSPERGWGLEPGAEVQPIVLHDDALLGDGLISAGPFRFSIKLPEGNYRVLVHAAAAGPGTLTIKAETRRLMAQQVAVSPDQPTVIQFIVNTRTPQIAGGAVKLNAREAGATHWDDKLTVEFLGDQVAITAIDIAPAPDVPTVYLIGDSTVTDQQGEPYCGWGQMLPRFFDTEIAIANHAESGRSVRSFLGERRFDKILETLRAGDYVFIQFGHNDMKEKGEGIGPYESFTTGLRGMIAQIKDRGATPVLVTSMHRRRFDDQGKVVDTLEQYPQAMRKLAADDGIALIDLNVMSAVFYEAMGPIDSTAAFVHYPANTFPNQPERLRDDTHHNAYGAYVLARYVVEGIRSSVPDLAEHLAGELPAFDPSAPPAPDTVVIPPSLQPNQNLVPEGR